MRITLQSPATHAGEKVTVRSSHGEWPAIWQGEDGTATGSDVDVEVEIADPVSWSNVSVTSSEEPGISRSGDRLLICGRIDNLFDDDVIALNLQPGLVLVEMEGTRPRIRAGNFITISSGDISIYPTEI